MNDVVIVKIPNSNMYELTTNEYDEGKIFLGGELLPVAQALSNELGINDLMKLRDHVEQKIKEIYSVKEG